MCLWLTDDLLLHRVPLKSTTLRDSKVKEKKKKKMAESALSKRKRLEMEERERELEAELLAQQLGVPVEEVPDMLADDRLDYMPPAVLQKIAEEELTRSKAE